MEDILVWEALEYEPRNNSSDWYWTVGIITVALVVISILLGNTLFGILIALSSIILTAQTMRHPRTLEVAINKKGIRVDARVYDYEHLESFCVAEKEFVPKLIIKSKKLLMPHIIIRLDGADPYEVEAELKDHLPEELHYEPLAHKLLDYLGF